MINEDWIKNFHKLTELTNLSTDKQAEFYRSILVAGASVLGILISLHSTQTSCLYTRLVFALSICLLLLGVLLSAIVLRDLSLLPERTKKAFVEELQKVLSENRNPNLVNTPKKKRTLHCEKWSLIVLLFSLFLLVIYTILSLFVN